MKKNVCVILAEGFEEIEALTVVDILRRADILVSMVSLDERECVTGAHDIKVLTEKSFAEVDLNEYDALVLPGGGLGTQNLSESKAVENAIYFMNDNNKLIAAICAAPSVLGKYGLLEGKNACCYPGFEEKLAGAEITYNGVERAGNIITARAMGVSIDFSLEIVDYLLNEEAKTAVADAIIYKR